MTMPTTTVSNEKSVRDVPMNQAASNELSTIRKLSIIGGIYVSFLVYGMAQEYVFETGTDDDKFTFGHFLTFCVAFANVFAAAILMLLEDGYDGMIHRLLTLPQGCKRSVAHVSLSSTIAMVSTANALRYVNLPTQVLMKSAKSVPVMVGNLLRGKVYPWYDNVTVVGVSMMLILFNLAKMKSNAPTGDNSIIGLGLLGLSLVMDGITGPTQDATVSTFRLRPNELMLIQNIFSSTYAFILWVVFDGITEPVAFIDRHPDILRWLVLYCLCGIGGQMAIYQAIVYFGSLYVSLITTVRKFFTVLLSVFIFGHPLNRFQWASVAGIFLLLTLQSVFKHRASETLKQLKEDVPHEKNIRRIVSYLRSRSVIEAEE